jgi:outer membrane protein OmpA-like peptidoglycan-associated protein
MKKKIVASLLLSLLLTGQVNADNTSQTLDRDGLKGPLGGALAGGLLAGPPGALAGMIGGALIGEINLRGEKVKQTETALLEAEDRITHLQGVSTHQESELRQLQLSGRTRLEAVSEGFSFCLRFRTESDQIEPGLLGHLSALAVMLNAFPELDIEVRAAADRRGSETYNQELSERRARAVVARLLQAGVDARRIKTRFVGEQLAQYAEQDLEGLAFDRYVVVSLQPGKLL